MSEFELKIDPENLEEELATQSAKYSYVANQYTKADLEYSDFTAKLELLYIKLDMDVRAAAEADGKKITEKVVENTVKVSEAYQNANAHCRKLKAHRDTKRNDEKAFGSMRSSSLTQMSANRRSELESLAFSEMKAA